MRLLLLNYEYPPLGGGAGVCTKYHAEGLVNLGYQVDVVTTWFEGEEEKTTNDKLTIYRLKAKRKLIHKSDPLEMLSWVNASKIFLRQHVKNVKYDYCLAHFAIPGGLVSKWLKRKYKVPYIIISHGQDIPWFMPKQLFLYHFINYKRLQNILKESHSNVLLTEMMKEKADKMLPKRERKKNIIIPNAADIYFFTPKTQHPETFRILFSSRLVQQKDVFVFLKALKILKEKQTTFSADIVGNGPLLYPMMRYVKEHKLEENVFFHKWVSKKELLTFYHNASLFVITSREEAMSLALLEALNCGLYTITTPVSGTKDVIKAEVNGDFINFRDCDTLAEKIIQYKKNNYSKRYFVPQESIKALKQTYNWDRIAESYDKLLKTLNH